MQHELAHAVRDGFLGAIRFGGIALAAGAFVAASMAVIIGTVRVAETYIGPNREPVRCVDGALYKQRGSVWVAYDVRCLSE